MPSPTHPKLSLLPHLVAVAHGQPAHVDLIVRASAPPAPAQPSRPTMNLALVIDCSGSMSGQPIQEAKAAAASLVGRLQAGDQVCVIGYAGERAWVAAEPVDAANGRTGVLQAIAGLSAGGGTPLRSGWLMGAQALAPTVSRYGLSRVLLLSDGQATDNSQPSAIAQEARELAAAGIGTSTYGLGHNFNEDLMTQLAQGGSGQAFYAETADALVPYFESEFAMLASTVGKKVKVSLRATAGEKVLQALRLDTLEPAQDQPLSALIAGADSFVGFRVPFEALSSGGGLQFVAELSWEDLDGTPQTQKATLDVPAKARAKASSDAWAQERLKEIEAARVQREALASARRGDWAHTETLLRGIQGSAMGNAYVANVANSLSAMAATRNIGGLAKEVAYASATMLCRTVDAGENVASMDAGRFGLRKAEQGKAASQDEANGKALKRGRP